MKKLILLSALLTVNYYLFEKFIVSPSAALTSVSGPTSTRSPASVNTLKQTDQVKNSWSFNYKDLSKQPFSIKKQANSYAEAYKSASKECFQILTDGKYPGEEKGLDIIDICANPKS